MKTALAIRHVHFEHLGVFEAALGMAGYQIRYSDAGLDTISPAEAAAADLLIVLGAPIGAYEDDTYPFLKETLRALDKRLAAGQPTLGICLGAQLMARALGAKVYPGSAKEIGWAKVSLTSEGMQSPLKHLQDVPVLHWHGDTFDMPMGATRLASTDITPNQAFSIGSHALALQFHPELDGARFEPWLIGHACEIAGAKLSPTKLRDDTARFAAKAASQAKLLISDWLSQM